MKVEENNKQEELKDEQLDKVAGGYKYVEFVDEKRTPFEQYSN